MKKASSPEPNTKRRRLIRRPGGLQTNLYLGPVAVIEKPELTIAPVLRETTITVHPSAFRLSRYRIELPPNAVRQTDGVPEKGGVNESSYAPVAGFVAVKPCPEAVFPK